MFLPTYFSPPPPEKFSPSYYLEFRMSEEYTNEGAKIPIPQWLAAISDPYDAAIYIFEVGIALL